MSAGDQVTKASVEGNELSRIDQLERDVATLRATVMSLGSLDQATENIGSVTQGEWRFKDDNDVLRMIISTINLLAEFGIKAHFAGFDEHGNPTVWLDADDGDFTAGRGAVRLNRNGIEVPDAGDAITLSDSLWLLHAHMYMSNGYFVLANYRVANEWNEILNGDFETGDLTNWTETDPSGKINVVAYEEGYKCSFSDTAMATENIKQSVTAPNGCIITFKAKSTNNCVVTIRDTMTTNIESLYTYPEWRNYVVIFDNPCTEFYIGFDCAGEQGDIDDVVVRLKSGSQTVSRIRFGPNGGTENFGSLEVNPSSRTDGFFRVRSAAGDAGPGSPSYLFYVNPVTGKIGIRKQNPAYELDLEGDLNISGNFRKNGVVIGGDPWTEIVKSADQDETSTTLVNTTGLQISADAGVYHFQLYLVYSGNGAGYDYKFDFLPSAGNMFGWYRYTGDNNSADAILVSTGIRLANNPTITAIVFGTDNLDNPRMALIEGMLRFTDANTFNFRMAINTAGTGKHARTYAGTVLRYRKLS